MPTKEQLEELTNPQLEFLCRKIAISPVKYAKWSHAANKLLNRYRALKKASSTKSGTPTKWRGDAIPFLTLACDDALLATVFIMKGSRSDTSSKTPKNGASSDVREYTAAEDTKR